MVDTSNLTKQQSDQVDILQTQAREEIAAQLEVFFENILEHSYKYSGAGSYFAQFHKALARIDRYGVRPVTHNNEHAGLVFLTRPRLNLSSSNLKQNRVLSMLNTKDNQTIQFMIRMLLDTRLAEKWADLCINSPLIDQSCPFMTPVMNAVESISGFPSSNMETYTTEGGFYSEDMSIAIGSDRNRKSFDLQMSFVDIQGGVISAILQFWYLYIELLTVGEVVSDYQYVNQQRLNYTSSLYRFLLDPSKRFITRWCKCTGGFPISRPGGAVFDYNQSEIFVEAARKFSVTFKFNHFGDENDPIILKEFNILMKRYNPYIDSGSYMESLDNTPETNYLGLPYIVMTSSGPMIDWRKPKDIQDNTVEDSLLATQTTIQSIIDRTNQSIDGIINTPTTTNSSTTTSVPVTVNNVTYI